MKTKWNNLSDVRRYLVENKLENVVSFDGHELITDEHVYTLAFGQLTTKDRVA